MRRRSRRKESTTAWTAAPNNRALRCVAESRTETSESSEDPTLLASPLCAQRLPSFPSSHFPRDRNRPTHVFARQPHDLQSPAIPTRQRARDGRRACAPIRGRARVQPSSAAHTSPTGGTRMYRLPTEEAKGACRSLPRYRLVLLCHPIADPAF